MTLTEQEIKQIEQEAHELFTDASEPVLLSEYLYGNVQKIVIGMLRRTATKYLLQLKSERERAGKLLEALVKCLEATKELNGEYQDGWDKEIEQAETAIHNYKNNQ